MAGSQVRVILNPKLSMGYNRKGQPLDQPLSGGGNGHTGRFSTFPRHPDGQQHALIAAKERILVTLEEGKA